MDGIPKALPALAKATKMIGKMKRAGFDNQTMATPHFQTEEELGALLWSLCASAKEKGFNPEHALRDATFARDKEFRAWEKQS